MLERHLAIAISLSVFGCLFLLGCHITEHYGHKYGDVFMTLLALCFVTNIFVFTGGYTKDE